MIGPAGVVAVGRHHVLEREELFTTPGTYTWTCPPGVEYVSVVCIGGGGGGMYYNNSSSTYTYAMSGGGGGALAWMNDLAVTPGTNYTVRVGAGGSQGAYSSGSSGGGNSYFRSTLIINANGGNPGRYNSTLSAATYYVNPNYGSSMGGGNGGINYVTSFSGYGPTGGGGAGGYSGQGGRGRDDGASRGDNGSGGGGGGGGASTYTNTVDHVSGGGGGVGVYGEGNSGGASLYGYGFGGSGGGSGGYPHSNVNSTSTKTQGGLYGGGGGGSSSVYWSIGGDGANGAVRLIYRVTGLETNLSFPSTDTTIRRKQTVV